MKLAGKTIVIFHQKLEMHLMDALCAFQQEKISANILHMNIYCLASL